MLSDKDFFTCLCLVSTSPEVECWVELVFKMIQITLNIKLARKVSELVEWLVGVWWGGVDSWDFVGFCGILCEVHVLFQF